MAFFRRKRSTRTIRFRPSTRAALARKANKRFDKLTAFQEMICEILPEFPVSSCGGVETDPLVQPNRIVLVSDATKEQFFEDSVTVVRVESKLEFEPNFTLDTGEPAAVIAQRLQWQWQFFGGLRKIRQHIQGSFDDTPTQGIDEPIPAPLSSPNDRTDLFWYNKKYRAERFVDRARQSFHTLPVGAIIGTCNRVTAEASGPPENNMSSGSGTTVINATVTDCCADVCFADDTVAPVIQMVETNMPLPNPRVKHYFNSRKRISLKGKEALVYDFEVLVPEAFGSDTPRQGNVSVFGYVDVVLET